MITKEYELNQMPGYPFERDYPLNRIAYFDIETTGFAADSSYLYLIGCAYYKNKSFHLTQWFSESLQEETMLITTFFEFLKNYDVLIHYNGTGFDIPYLLKKVQKLGLTYTFDSVISLDIYKKLNPYKKIFKLNNFKLKSIELFLNIHRKDTFSGGDLIQVYQSYLGKKHFEALYHFRNPDSPISSPTESDLLLGQLLLHNMEDIQGLLLISPILNYVDLFERPFQILQTGVDGGILNIHFEINGYLPVRISYGSDLIHLTAFQNTALLTVHVYEGELKYFYDNYKDYYYLPAEDYAIHKSVAHFVDKDFRTKAKPSNCYTKKQGIFAPQYELLMFPNFKMNYQDKLTFLEVHTDFLLQEENLELYVKHLLSYLINLK